MAVTKHEAMGLIRLLRRASRLAALHPDSDVYTTAKNAIDAVITALLAAGVSEEG